MKPEGVAEFLCYSSIHHDESKASMPVEFGTAHTYAAADAGLLLYANVFVVGIGAQDASLRSQRRSAYPRKEPNRRCA